MLEQIVKEINLSLEHECFFSALTLALTLPDICGKAEYPNERNNKIRYKNWYKQHVEPTEQFPDSFGSDMLYSRSDIIYSLRCMLMHQGTPAIDLENTEADICENTDKFILTITDADSLSSGSSQNIYGKGFKLVKRILDINIRHLCYVLCTSSLNYYNSNKEKFTFFNYELVDKRSIGR